MNFESDEEISRLRAAALSTRPSNVRLIACELVSIASSFGKLERECQQAMEILS